MARDEAYRDAERKIEEARRSGATELDLSRRYDERTPRLTELPESLGQLTQLQSLKLSNNQLTTLPEWLGQLTRLQSLNLSHNQLTALPEWLGQFTQLQSLNLSRNQLTALPEWLSQLVQLRSLDLGDNQVTALPESLGQITQLQTLNCYANRLTLLAESFYQLNQLEELWLTHNRLTTLSEAIGTFQKLRVLSLTENPLSSLPESLGCLSKLEHLGLSGLQLADLPSGLGLLTELRTLGLSCNQLLDLPESLSHLRELVVLQAGNFERLGGEHFEYELSSKKGNRLKDLPVSLLHLTKLETLDLQSNPLNPELAAAYKEGLDAVKRYLRAKAEAQVVLNEAKLILIGEGEVGKSCLLAALRGDPWEEGRPTTHGIEIKPVKVTDPTTGTEITLNGWDFGGQRVYRPTHQLFFSAPAVYLVVWKPREGPQQGFVKEWIKLVKHREPEARILVVATHGGPRERQPDIDRQEIWDLFGRETVIDFLLVESKPDGPAGERRGIAELRAAIARVAAGLPDMGRTFPKHWHEVRMTLRGLLSRNEMLPLLAPLVSDEQAARTRLERLSDNRLCLERALAELGDLVLDEAQAREELAKARLAYLPLDRVFAICREHGIDEEDARLLLRICRSVGDLIHYDHDPALRDIVVLKPDWLATAMSFVLDDEETRKRGHGLIRFARLGQLWDDPERPAENRYPARLHPIFLRLMERFDLCYRVAETAATGNGTDADCTSLIAQLVPDVRPDSVPAWGPGPAGGDEQQVQVCRIVDAAKNESATAEGIFYQLIVRLHRYSLGRADYAASVHWQRGLVLEDDMGARAFLEHVGNDVRITVRSPYPERFLAALTYEVKWLVDSFWRGMRCEVTVPCLMRRADGKPCTGMFEVSKLIENKKRGRLDQPCPICNQWLGIEQLLHNAPAARPNPMDELLGDLAAVMPILRAIRQQLGEQQAQVIGRFDRLDAADRELVSKVEGAYDGLMHRLVDEAKEGPRLFSFQPVDPRFFDRPKWISEKFQLTLWCEHSRLPLPALNGADDRSGIYELTLPRQWVERAAPFLKVLTGTLSLVLPVAASATKLLMDEGTYKGLEKDLDLGQKGLDAVLKGAERSGAWLAQGDAPDLEHGAVVQAQGAVLRQLHAWLKEKDPGLGGLVRVQNKRQEFLWVHPQFEQEY